MSTLKYLDSPCKEGACVSKRSFNVVHLFFLFLKRGMDYFSKQNYLGRARGHRQKALDFEQKVAKKHTC